MYKDKHYLRRVAVVRYVDSLFYGTGDARWCHSRCNALITQAHCGIGENTYRNYLHYNHPELLVGAELPPALKELLRLYVLPVKKLPEAQAAYVLQELNRFIEFALYCGDRQEQKLNVDSPTERLRKVMKESFPEK